MNFFLFKKKIIILYCIYTKSLAKFREGKGNTTPKRLYTAQDQSDHRLRVEDVATIERLEAHPVGPTSLFNKELPKEPDTT